MTLDWSTFILEIINFLLLVWLLGHFLYKPVLNIINRRREEIEKQLHDAETARNEAESIKSKYEGRLTEWQREKDEAIKELHNEIDRERTSLLKQLESSLEQEHEKEQALFQRRLQEESRKNEKLALEQGTVFTTRLLSKLANPELENSIIRLSLETLNNYSDRDREVLHEALDKEHPLINVTSAYVLDETIRGDIEESLSRLFDQPHKFKYSLDSGLIAGIQIEIGAWTLSANLMDELKYFTENIDEEI